MDRISAMTRLNKATYEQRASIIENLHTFLGNDESEESEASLEERTKSAIILLQCLPCARSAVFEQIGEVFHEIAKKYVIEVENQILSGQADFPGQAEVHMPELDILVRNIQEILAGFVKSNCDAWAPQISRWSINLVGELCSQYGVLRAFKTLPIDERMQLWMNCEASRILIEISVTCFAKIIEDKPDLCVEYLLETAAQNSPFFDWIIAHICCCFLDVVPYGILSHALQAFSMQAKNAEMIINCVTRVYNYLLSQHGRVLQNAVLDLFKDSVAALTVEAGSEQEHIDKCTLPFLLHLALQAPQLVDQVTGKVVDLLDLKTMAVLNEQSSKRDAILQRGLLSRTLDILKNIGSGTFKIIMFLVNNACEKSLSSEGDPKLLNERRRISGTILEMLLLSLQECVRTLSSDKSNDDLHLVSHLKDDKQIDSHFLKDLHKNSIDMCKELLKSSSTRANVLVRIICITSLYGKEKTAVNNLAFLLLNSQNATNLMQVVAVQCELSIYIPDITERYVDEFIERLCSYQTPLGNVKIFNALNNIITLIQDTKIQSEQNRKRFRQHLRQKWHVLSRLACFGNEDIAAKVIRLLDLLQPPNNLPLSENFKAIMNLMRAYFNCLRRIFENEAKDEDSYWETTFICDKLLVRLVGDYPNLQQSAVRLLLETLLKKESIQLITSSSLKLEHDDDEVYIKEPKVQLLEMNNQPDVASRIPVNRSSVIYAGSLNRNKRKITMQNNTRRETTSGRIQQCLLNTIDHILSLKVSTLNENLDVDMSHVKNSFTDFQFSRMVDSKSSYNFLATFMAELICPDVIPTLPWPDEEFLKYTVERDIKIRKQFEQNPFLWHVLSLISAERPSLCYCPVIVQSLLSSCLMYWEVDRKKTVTASVNQLKTTCKTLDVMKQAGWIPEPWCNMSDILPHLKPHEIYRLLSGVWRFCKGLNLSPLRFSTKDNIGRPSIAFHPGQVSSLRQLFRDIFLNNMTHIGIYYKRFFSPAVIIS